MTPKELEPCSPLSQCFGKTPKCKRECEEDSCRIVPVPKCQDVEDTVSYFDHLPITFFCTVYQNHQKCHILILAFSIKLCLIKIDLSSDTVGLQATIFHKLTILAFSM